MKEKDLKRMFDQCQLQQPGKERKEEQMQQIIYAYRSIRPSHRKTKLQRWAHAAGNLSCFTWLLQAGLLLLIGFAYFVDWMNAEALTIFIAPLLGIIGILELMRSYAWNMWELEQSCRYNLLEMMSIKMIIMGLLDLVVLLVLGAVGSYERLGINGFLLQILIPFLLSNALYLWMLGHFRNSCGIGLLLSAGIFMSMLNLQLARGVSFCLRILERMGGQAVVDLLTLLSIGVLAAAIRQFLKNCESEELKVWNFN